MWWRSVVDECGECGGDNSTCLDECGVINGDDSTCTDECGVINGDGLSCSTVFNVDMNCAGVEFSLLVLQVLHLDGQVLKLGI